MKIASHPRFWSLTVLLAADLAVFCGSDPQQVPSFVLAGAFVLLMVTLYQLALAVLLAANWYGLPGKAHRHRQARVVTGVGAGLLALQSIGELGLRDVLVLLPLALIAYLYISYGKGRPAAARAGAQNQPVASLMTLE